MKRIAILGCENSHADAFLKCIAEKQAFSDVEVIGVYSDDRGTAERLKENFNVPILESYSEAVGRIDGLVITARHGDNHYRYAKPYIESGIPMFIDKPITVREDEAVELMRALKARGVRLCGGSSLKQDVFVQRLKKEREDNVGGKTVGGYVRAPYQSKNEYGGFYFYAQHLVEMVCEIFGRYPLSVAARKNGSRIHVLFHYADYDCVGLFCDENYTYYASRMAETGTSSFDIPSTEEWFEREFGEFYRLLSGDRQSATYQDVFAPVFILNAIDRSLKSGREENVAYQE